MIGNEPTERSRGRAGNDLTCRKCGKPLQPSRASRRMRFCSNACRQSDFRGRKWALRYKAPRPLRSVKNTSDGSTAYNGNFGDRGSGIYGPMGVISRELFDGLMWRPAVSPDGVRAEIARPRVIPEGRTARARIKGG
jgi:endogenous inhibitor of DNA gyrase (YacG/DUF329 family)